MDTEPERPDRQRVEEIMQIAEALAREQGKPIRDVWHEAMAQHRGRFDSRDRPTPKTKKG